MLNFLHRISRAFRFPALRAVCVLALLAIAMVRAPAATLTGPVPSPTDAYGMPGPFAVQTQTFASPGWADHSVTVFSPVGASGPRPTWFFSHGFGGFDVTRYQTLPEHLASHGWAAVFSPYPTNGSIDELYAILYDGFVAAATRYPTLIDTRKVGFAGHSFGGGATPPLALRAFREPGWGADARCLLTLAPWHSAQLSNTDLQSFPAGTLAVVQVYEDDILNDHRMAIDVFRRINIPAADKDYLFVRSDEIDGYGYNAAHLVPSSSGTNTQGEIATFDALDAWAVQRIAAALGHACFDNDTAARAIALGGGSDAQTQMGVSPGGRALRPMVSSDEPYPLFPQSRYAFPWFGLLNPRRLSAPPEAPTASAHLVNISARARTDVGDNLLIVGGVTTGSRPKSLLTRVVGPTLVNFGVPGAMLDPRLVTFLGPAADLANDNWSDLHNVAALDATTTETSAFTLPQGSKDAALVASFPAARSRVRRRSQAAAPGSRSSNSTTQISMLRAG